MKPGTTPTIQIDVPQVIEYLSAYIFFKGSSGQIIQFDNPERIGTVFQCPFTQEQTELLGVGNYLVEAQINFETGGVIKTYISRGYNAQTLSTVPIGNHAGGGEPEAITLSIIGEIVYGGGSGGVTNHSLLTNLAFNQSGHTGFQEALTFGDNLTLSEEKKLDVKVVDELVEGSMQPITSGAVYATVGNIHALLKTI